MNDQSLKLLLFQKVNHALSDLRDWLHHGEMIEETIAARHTYNTLYQILIDAGLEDEYFDWKYKGETKQ